jgi:hypothetical protein
MGTIPVPLTDFQRQIIANVANTESFSWRAKYFDAVESALFGRGHQEITDEDVNMAIRRGVNAADRAWDDDCDCCG